MLANVVILFFLIVAFGREYVGNIQVDREIADLESQKSALQQEQLNTLDLIDQLSSRDYLEHEARTKHGLAEPGETLVIIQDDSVPAGEVAGAQDAAGDERVSNPKRWFYYFFDKQAYESLQVL